MQLQRVAKGNLRLLPIAATAENAPFTNQSRCALRFLRSLKLPLINFFAAERRPDGLKPAVFGRDRTTGDKAVFKFSAVELRFQNFLAERGVFGNNFFIFS